MEYLPLQAPPRERYSGALADTLLSAKAAGNKYQVLPWVPLIGGTGLGQLFMGDAPELANDVSYNGLQALARGGNVATGGMGTYAPDKRTFDAAMLGLDAYGITKGAGMLGRAGVRKGLNTLYGDTHSPSRREFLKTGAKAGALAAAGATGLGALRKATKEGAEQVAEVAPKQAVKAAPKYKFNSLKEYNDYLTRQAEDISSESGFHPDFLKRVLAEQEEKAYYNAKQAAASYGGHDKHIAALKSKLENPILSSYDRQQYTKAIQDLENPDFTLRRFSPQAKAEMKAFKEQARKYDVWAPGETEAAALNRGYALRDSVPNKFDVLDDYLANPNYFTDRRANYLKPFEFPIDDMPF